MKKLMSIILVMAVGLMAVGFITKSNDSQKPWPVPDKYNKMVNPQKTDAESVKNGKALYVKHCQSCHGKAGLGDGTKSSTLDTDPGDFSTAAFHKQSDGSLFYKTAEGRDDMPSFKKKITDETDIWDVVNFLRTLKK